MKRVGKLFSEVILEQSKVLSEYLKDFSDCLDHQAAELDRFYALIEKCGAIHLYGKGRTANSAISLALRLKHFGYNVWFIGDVVKERIKRGDLVILFSGSGETSEVVTVAKRSKQDGAKVVAITSYRKSTLGKYSDLIILLPGGLEKSKGWEYLEAQIAPQTKRDQLFYGGGEFETVAYLFQETLVSALGKYKKIPCSIVFKEHEHDEVMEDKENA
jgi:6-phospho 3-hexuloisomerase